MSDSRIQIPIDVDLLNLMTKDQRKSEDIYHPGSYWERKAINSTKNLSKFSLNGFRGGSSPIGMSYADNPIADVRNSISPGIKKSLLRLLRAFPPLNDLMDSQVAITHDYYIQMMTMKQELLVANPRVHQLLRDWVMPYSLLGGCETSYLINGRSISELYLTMLDRHEICSSIVDFKEARVFCEIGGGFGANVHLILSNYSNIKKIIYIDIPPNLYVGTQYLRSFYGSSVLDYRRLGLHSNFHFADTDDLEILCIAPWQMERVHTEIDIFQNDSSFVEMPGLVIEKYHQLLERWDMKSRSARILGSYLPNDPKTTMDPKSLTAFSPLRTFTQFTRPQLCHPQSEYLFQISAA